MKLNLLPPEEDETFDFTPFVTIVLLLFFFYVATSSFLKEAKAYKITLPSGDTSQVVSRDDADGITLTANDEIWYRTVAGEEKLKSFQELEDKLKERFDASRPVLLRYDRSCTLDQYMKIKNVAINSGATTLYEEVNVRP